jgi:hypothetical protein
MATARPWRPVAAPTANRIEGWKPAGTRIRERPISKCGVLPVGVDDAGDLRAFDGEDAGDLGRDDDLRAPAVPMRSGSSILGLTDLLTALGVCCSAVDGYGWVGAFAVS